MIRWSGFARSYPHLLYMYVHKSSLPRVTYLKTGWVADVLGKTLPVRQGSWQGTVFLKYRYLKNRVSWQVGTHHPMNSVSRLQIKNQGKVRASSRWAPIFWRLCYSLDDGLRWLPNFKTKTFRVCSTRHIPIIPCSSLFTLINDCVSSSIPCAGRACHRLVQLQQVWQEPSISYGVHFQFSPPIK
ncbi:hypothetical protein ASPVEDRAFT_429207 [Aspergillus versicolor CBS 583.65]|uniref:Uncharacterized protein n=1 Tax=Aspergillus versicolor CBS 583.65 TaxID=1036611 RepID=A0A1L9P8I0_ASPVE|nr:uncharacterized protein ASPVEDRAFT_429207 [Aspergillus versicolor CBS 583.65]OJI97796.1 hypothetical protein ASPVEDRAFT_429207 [Aspergillus versicolor CBS 583.65]